MRQPYDSATLTEDVSITFTDPNNILIDYLTGSKFPATLKAVDSASATVASSSFEFEYTNVCHNDSSQDNFFDMIPTPLESAIHTSGDTSVITTNIQLFDYASETYGIGDDYTLCNPVKSYIEATPG